MLVGRRRENERGVNRAVIAVTDPLSRLEHTVCHTEQAVCVEERHPSVLPFWVVCLGVRLSACIHGRSRAIELAFGVWPVHN